MYASTHWLRVASGRTLMCISGWGILAAVFLLWTLFAPIKNWAARIAFAVFVVLLDAFLYPTL